MSNKFPTLWYRVCDSLNISRSIADEWLENIQTRYDGEAQRFFHNSDLLELKSNFILTDDVGKTIDYSNRILIAIPFQYYHFDAKSDCCDESLSAFKEFADVSGLMENDNFVQSVLQLLGDASANGSTSDDEFALYQDLDLIILGLSDDKYDIYIEQLQKEHSHLDINSYKQMRLRILTTFLTIPQIYATAAVSAKYETNARENIKREIEELKN